MRKGHLSLIFKVYFKSIKSDWGSCWGAHFTNNIVRLSIQVEFSVQCSFNICFLLYDPLSDLRGVTWLWVKLLQLKRLKPETQNIKLERYHHRTLHWIIERRKLMSLFHRPNPARKCVTVWLNRKYVYLICCMMLHMTDLCK